jgi:hypothetical protein
MELTGSQKIALVDALLELLIQPRATQTFIDCSKSPAVETTVTDLLQLVQGSKPIPGTIEIPIITKGKK